MKPPALVRLSLPTFRSTPTPRLSPSSPSITLPPRNHPSSRSLLSTYPLSRSPLSTARLIAQHALWQHDLRFLLHPTIQSSLSLPTPSSTSPPHNTTSPTTPLRIHDLATGTALWPLSLLQSLTPPPTSPAHPQSPTPAPNTAPPAPRITITASDISLLQTPPPSFLPAGLQTAEWDIYSPAGVPPHWVSAFDIIHIRLALLVVQHGEAGAREVVRRGFSMLRPGGWMQWDELDVEGAGVLNGATPSPSPEIAAEKARFLRMQELASLENLRWVRRLPGLFGEVGFGEVGREGVEGERSSAGLLQMLQFLVMQEEMEGFEMAGKEEGERVRGDIEWGRRMVAERGWVRYVPKVVVVGRKPG